nr:ATP-binding cassette sub-family F member 1-like [Zootoca vivipara]
MHQIGEGRSRLIDSTNAVLKSSLHPSASLFTPPPTPVTFKKMYQQKQKELLKQYEKQEKKLKDLKAGGKSTKQAEKQTKEALTRKQQKCRKKNPDEEASEVPELLKRPKEYTVKFTFPNPPPLSPPILGLHGTSLP